MNTILIVANIVVLLTLVFILIRYSKMRVEGVMPTPLLVFIAILFTSGLDVGLIMFPLTEFPTYAEDPIYAFTNPLAIEFGFWGFLVWAMYFFTTFYFVAIEPKVKLFEIPIIKLINNFIIITTCSFTAYLFLIYLPSYIVGIPDTLRYALVALVIMLAVLSSTHIRFVKILSVSSTWLFLALIVGIFLFADMGLDGLGQNTLLLSEYFVNIHHFVLPISDYHAFYLFWWFSWSIMIGQFVARFVGNIAVWQLFLAMLIIPSIPLGIWLSILYFVYEKQIAIPDYLTNAMVVVGVIFVINSLDSLIRLYSANFKITAGDIGHSKYIAGNFVVMSILVLLYQFTPFKIEWVGLAVIGIYITIYFMLLLKKPTIKGNLS